MAPPPLGVRPYALAHARAYWFACFSRPMAVAAPVEALARARAYLSQRAGCPDPSRPRCAAPGAFYAVGVELKTRKRRARRKIDPPRPPAELTAAKTDRPPASR